MTRVRRVAKLRRLVDLPEDLVTYLTTGEYGSDFDSFMLAGQVLRGRLDGLRAAWAQYGPSILAAWPDDEPAPFAQHVLENVADGDWSGMLATLAERRSTSAESAADDQEPADERLTF